jgi:hypothetical protein
LGKLCFKQLNVGNEIAGLAFLSGNLPRLRTIFYPPNIIGMIELLIKLRLSRGHGTACLVCSGSHSRDVRQWQSAPQTFIHGAGKYHFPNHPVRTMGCLAIGPRHSFTHLITSNGRNGWSKPRCHSILSAPVLLYSSVKKQDLFPKVTRVLLRRRTSQPSTQSKLHNHPANHILP